MVELWSNQAVLFMTCRLCSRGLGWVARLVKRGWSKIKQLKQQKTSDGCLKHLQFFVFCPTFQLYSWVSETTLFDLWLCEGIFPPANPRLLLLRCFLSLEHHFCWLLWEPGLTHPVFLVLVPATLSSTSSVQPYTLPLGFVLSPP